MPVYVAFAHAPRAVEAKSQIHGFEVGAACLGGARLACSGAGAARIETADAEASDAHQRTRAARSQGTGGRRLESTGRGGRRWTLAHRLVIARIGATGRSDDAEPGNHGGESRAHG